MSRLSASTPASPAATRLTITKPKSMEEYLSMINAAAPQSQLFGKGREAECILSSFADNYEAWAYPDTQQQVFFDEWIAAAPPPTALASPSLATQQHALLDASALSPALSSPSLGSSSQSSPALNLVNSLQSASAASVQPPLSVADYAAALFPDLAASLSGTLSLPIESPAGFAKPASAMASQPFAQASASPAALSTWATDLASMLEAQTPVSPAESQAESASPEPMPSLVHVAGETDEQRKRRDCEFLESLPPQLRLKRRRTSNTKQKEKILAELLQPAAPLATTAASVPMKKTPAKKPKAADDEADGEVLDAAALKRKKNTDAARRSRMRKILRIETLEGRVSELESENAQLVQRIAQLEAEKEAAMAQRI
ncbi:hypothetical protein IWW40_004499 [Coemansia sp. RSA 1250]|nr:hypothetical protein IWW40_004499 [Coemansia sp. RSA 1250]